MQINELLQLTQGLLVASTALLGLSGLFVAQLTLGAEEDTIDRLIGKEQYISKWLLFSSVILGVLAILLCLINLWVKSDCLILYLIATILTAFQVVTFAFLTIFLIFRKFNKKP